MHILELPSFFPPYGGLFCLDQSRALNTGDNTVRILANVNLSARLSPQLYFRGERNTFFMQMQGVEVMKHYMRGIPFFTRANAMWWLRSTERLVEKYMAKYGKPDIIHAHCCQWAGCAAFRVWRKHGIPYVITEHLSSELILKEYTADTGKAWQIPYVEEAYRNAALVIPVSGELVDDLKTIYRWDCKWQVVSNIVDTAFFGYRKRLPLTPRRPLRLCCIANFVVGKGYDVMFEAVRKYLDTTGDKVEIVLPDPEVTLTATQIDHEGVREKVSLFRSRFTDEEVTQIQRQGRDDIIKSIPRLGIIENARQNAARQLVPIVEALGYRPENITVTFRKRFTISDIPNLIKTVEP